ncbi:MAG TPA: alpha/beta hydrolase [Devosia sp.]|nr:alpha/beta hydrolase [Devosia sp.]
MTEFLSSDGVRIVYDDLGPRDGVPVVLCHGLASAGRQLLADAEYFAAEGFRVLVPDLRGHGRSGKPEPLSAEAFVLARMALDQIEMLDHAGTGPVHWVGNSLGGIVALEMLAEHAGRFRTLATFGTSYALNLPDWSGNMLPPAYRVLGPYLIGAIVGRTTTRNKAAQPMIATLIRGFDPEVGRYVANEVARYDLIANAVAVSLPILLLRGARDGAVNTALGSTLAAMEGKPNFSLVELKAGGHCANLDDTDAFRAALLDFWAR